MIPPDRPMNHNPTVFDRSLFASSWPGEPPQRRGLSRPSTSFNRRAFQDVDARHKAGHDEWKTETVGIIHAVWHAVYRLIGGGVRARRFTSGCTHYHFLVPCAVISSDEPPKSVQGSR